MPDEPRIFENEVVWLPELTRGEDVGAIVEDHRFVNCTITGPAVVVSLGHTTINGSALEGNPDAVLWELPPTRTEVVGAIGLLNCVFEACVFSGVGFAGPPDVVEYLRKRVELVGASESEEEPAPTV